MIAAGNDTTDGEMRCRLDYMVDELEICQQANGNGYVGGIPGSRQLWKGGRSGQYIERDQRQMGALVQPAQAVRRACATPILIGGNAQAREVLVALGGLVRGTLVSPVRRAGAADARRRAGRHERSAGRRLRASPATASTSRWRSASRIARCSSR